MLFDLIYRNSHFKTYIDLNRRFYDAIDYDDKNLQLKSNRLPSWKLFVLHWIVVQPLMHGTLFVSLFSFFSRLYGIASYDWLIFMLKFSQLHHFIIVYDFSALSVEKISNQNEWKPVAIRWVTKLIVALAICSLYLQRKRNKKKKK